MPWVSIKTGIPGADGRETILREYLCDAPDCAHVAEHVVGVVRDPAMMCALCRTHAAMAQNRASSSEAE